MFTFKCALKIDFWRYWKNENAKSYNLHHPSFTDTYLTTIWELTFNSKGDLYCLKSNVCTWVPISMSRFPYFRYRDFPSKIRPNKMTLTQINPKNKSKNRNKRQKGSNDVNFETSNKFALLLMENMDDFTTCKYWQNISCF